MAIDTRATFSDWYWYSSVEATELRALNIETALSPVTSDIINNIPESDKLPTYLKSMLQNIAKPEQPSWDNCLVRFVSNVGNSLLERILGHEIKEYDYHMNEYLHNTLITPDIANILRLRGKITDELWEKRQLAGGFSDIEGTFIYESQKPYPSIDEIIHYCRYNLSPDNPKGDVQKRIDISDADYTLWEWLSYLRLNTEQTLNLMKRKLIDMGDASQELKRMGWQEQDRLNLLSLAWSVPNAQIMLQGDLVNEQDEKTIYEHIQEADITPEYAKTYVDAVLTKPASQDMIAYMLRKDPTLSNLPKELRKLGIHYNYYDVYKELAYQIPPIQDIITMAVREAFTPAIATRFGQYEDLPQPFIEYATKKGLTKEWAERYWASHWSLPSPQQGFEMFQRGIIQRDDLLLLLRALDIMPYWRDKLVQLAYNPLTRVDVRRMYQVGVLNEQEVNKAYHNIGYDDTNAAKLTEFTIRNIRNTLSGIKSNDVINAYKNYYITDNEARNLLGELGIKSNEISNILQAASIKRSWSEKDVQISAIENQYKKNRIDESKARSSLSSLGLPSNHIDTLMAKWQPKKEAAGESLWTTAQTVSFLKAGTITEERAKQELTLLGYDTEHINAYISSATTQTE